MAASAGLDEELSTGSGALRDRLDGLRRSFTAASSPGSDLDAALDSMHQRAEMLHRDLHSVTEQSFDPVQAELQSIRRRLEMLQQSVDHRPQ